MNGAAQKVFTILLVEDNGGDVEMFLRTVEAELPREEDEQVELVLAARAEGALAILTPGEHAEGPRPFETRMAGPAIGASGVAGSKGRTCTSPRSTSASFDMNAM